MSKKVIQALCIVLLLATVATLILPAMASQPEITVESAEDLLQLSENCSLDAYSSGLTVSLEANIDLSGTEFAGIPVFNGTFLGNGHRIDGLSLTGKGSVQGLFRYLGRDAVVENLTVAGAISPDGSRRQVGGIAGSNAGVIRGCAFEGEVSGSDCVGGIAGTNEVSGIIEDCTSVGSLRGTHRVGGTAGENFGLIHQCRNDASVNVSAEDNDVTVSEITADTIMGTESPDTVTDLGGIAGISTGVLRDCENHADVGYTHMGYNIGGIAGRQKGLIASCRNFGAVSGRKEVGGIVGQMEPVANLEFSRDTLQILQSQLTRTSGLANQASSNLHRNSQQLSNQMSQLHHEADTAMDAIRELMPTEENPELPDLDAIRAAQNTLSSSMSQIQSTMQSLGTTSGDSIRTAAGDIQAISSQINSMAETVRSASETMGGEVTDISDGDTEDNLTGKVLECSNSGAVSGDLNVGGVAGSVSWENDLDPEDDFQISGDESMNFSSELRAVLLRCDNSAIITAKKRNAGGICGNLALGLAKDCTNTGALDAENAGFVGGIAGISHGFIRSCDSKCILTGDSNVGGIAGSASIATDCRTLVRLVCEGEKLGTVLGTATEAKNGEENPIHDNLYLSVSQLGAIDGISYEGVAEPRSLEQFREIPDLSPIFDKATMEFRYEDGSTETVTVNLGEPLTAVPTVPEKDGEIGCWEQLENMDPAHIYFDLVVTPEYRTSRKVLESTNRRTGEAALMLAEGPFTQAEAFTLTESDAVPQLTDAQTPVESWTLPDFGSEIPTQLRLNLPEDLDPKDAAIRIQSADGSWRDPAAELSGRHIVFPVNEDDITLCLICAPAVQSAHLLGGGAVVILLAAVVAFMIHRRHKKQKPVQTEE